MKTAYDVITPLFLAISLLEQLSRSVSVGFFDDIYIPVSYLPQPSALSVPPHFFFLVVSSFGPVCSNSDTAERAYFWLGPDSRLITTHEILESPASERMYIDQNEIVRVRVEADDFYDDEPGPPHLQQAAAQREKRPPYTIIVRSFLYPETFLRTSFFF
jgi:DNA-directed RNA polymerase III subunit RPC8